jgi:RHH-type proline utilization regulon transcriptional repressor/proline dehydrogenase/delta 1-pyrroline-5-carboxylate dehydrogenase
MADSSSITARAIELAAEVLQQAARLQTPQERRQQAELDRMISHADDKATLVEMTDQAFRTHSPARVADQLTHLLDVQGVPRFFSPIEQVMLRGFQSFGEYLPGVAIPLVKEKMRRETANVILPAEPELLCEHIRNRWQQGVRMNVNLLGEAVLGEAESRQRMQQCIDTLRLPEVNCLSVKISTLYSQISPLARRHTIRKVADRLETLYRTADCEIEKSTGCGKFVYLDMEEYRDLHLTAEILCETLDRDGLQATRAGVALQAYIPDSYAVMQRLIAWSRSRVTAGGTPLTIRLVKGANLEMERVDASISGHPLAAYPSKLETDANYKRMLRELIDAAADGVVRVGLASHNLFDIALGILWAEAAQIGDALQVEMLEGMANHQRRAIAQHTTHLLLYAPACRREGFLNAIGYLIRRLDENSGPQNFLRHAYRLQVDSPEFTQLAEDFRKSLAGMSTVRATPRRFQDRQQAVVRPPAAADWSQLVNEPDTDWALPANSQWAEEILERWKPRCDQLAPDVPLTIGSQPVARDSSQFRESADPSRPGVVVCRYQAATLDQVRQAVAVAARDESQWHSSSVPARHALLREVAQLLRQRRGDLIGAMVAEAGKTVAEADPEVSEAIDFCEFYPLTVLHWQQRRSITIRPRGVVAVISPWNFPLAIPCGGIAAALAAGNTIVLKPAGPTVLVATLLCHAFWDAGVPRDALQLIPCSGSVAEQGLVNHPLVDTVILTGGTATARRMLAVRPGLHLLAETGGKNATIVTAMADRDLAIKHVLQSAFGHSGQKCSATSLLLLEDEVFADEGFKATLADAVNSIQVGSAWDLTTRMGPLIRPPQGELARGLKTLEDDESWLVVPEHVVENPNLYRPGVKWNIRPGGFTHLTELFGPVLGVMRFSRLAEAIEIVRCTGYGLTSGLESLDDREIAFWKQSLHAGNLYVNRPTTGAIVLRQPFGGVGLSAHGPGVKAGGPHYVMPLMHVADAPGGGELPAAPQLDPDPNACDRHEALDRLRQWLGTVTSQGQLDRPAMAQIATAIESGRVAMEVEFSQPHDTLRLIGQDNWRRYRAVRGVALRVQATDQPRDALLAIVAALAVRCQLTVSMQPAAEPRFKELLESAADAVPGLLHPLEESSWQLVRRIAAHEVARLRLLARVQQGSPLAAACGQAFVTIIDEPVLSEGRVECLRYLDEQSVSENYHRYGNLGRRVNEPRRTLL